MPHWADGPRREFDPRLEACPLCESRRLMRFAADHRGITIDRCRSCDLRFMNPQHTDRALSDYYASYIDPDQRQGASAARAERKRRNIHLLAGYVARGKFLAIGCGDGLELVLARDEGFDVEGYDVDGATVARVAAATGAEVHSGDLFGLELPRNSYACVFMDQVLEHPKNPAHYLRLVQDLLQPGGVCYIGVPNICSVSSRWKAFCDQWGLRPANRIGSQYDTWHHLHYYSPRSLRSVLARRFGFEVLALRGDPNPTGSELTYGLRRWWPFLDSGMIVIARKA